MRIHSHASVQDLTVNLVYRLSSISIVSVVFFVSVFSFLHGDAPSPLSHSLLSHHIQFNVLYINVLHLYVRLFSSVLVSVISLSCRPVVNGCLILSHRRTQYWNHMIMSRSRESLGVSQFSINSFNHLDYRNLLHYSIIYLAYCFTYDRISV